MEPLSYDGGNPVQYACGHPPAVLFYLLDRHAPLAMTKGTKWIIPQSLTTPAASRHPSNGGELGTFPPRPKSPFTTDGAAPSTVAEQSSSSSGGVARASVPGWSNPHRPRVERATRRIGRTNAHRPGSRANIVCVGRIRAGWSITNNK